MENKQTAIEWLLKEINERNGFIFTINYEELFNQAKAMEKEQKKDAFDKSRLTNPMIGFKHVTFEEYYNETYGK